MRKDVYIGDTKIGAVELMSISGDDNTIADAARVSFDKTAEDFDQTKNNRLVKYLYRNKHTSPFEMVGTMWKIEAPLFVARQWLRHRTASVNETSRRYVKDEVFVYTPSFYNASADNVKQGSSDEVHEMSDEYRNRVRELMAQSVLLYDRMVESGVAPEQARIHLPQGMMTSWIWGMDLHNLLHFLMLRTDEHAQKEIRVFAEAMLTSLRNTGQVKSTLEAFDELRAREAFSRNLSNKKTYKKNPEEVLRRLWDATEEL